MRARRPQPIADRARLRTLGGSIGLAVLVTIANVAGDHTTGTDRAFAIAALFMAAVAVAALLLRRQPQAA